MSDKFLFLKYIGFFICLLFAAPVFAQQNGLTAKSGKGFKADGNLDEWSTLRNTIKQDGYQYDVAADDSNVYVGIKIYDYYLRRKMLSTGLIAGLGDISITYPFPQNKPEEKKKDDKPGRNEIKPKLPAPKPQRDSSFKGFVAAIREMKIEGLSGGTRITHEPQKLGIKGSLGIDDDQNLTYEISIPKRFLAIKKGKANELALTIPAIKKNYPYMPYYNRMYDPYGRSYGGYGRGYGGNYGSGYGYLPPMPANTVPDGPDAPLYKKTTLKTQVLIP